MVEREPVRRRSEIGCGPTKGNRHRSTEDMRHSVGAQLSGRLVGTETNAAGALDVAARYVEHRRRLPCALARFWGSGSRNAGRRALDRLRFAADRIQSALQDVCRGRRLDVVAGLSARRLTLLKLLGQFSQVFEPGLQVGYALVRARSRTRCGRLGRL